MKKILIVIMILVSILTPCAFASDGSELDSGLPKLQEMLDTEEVLLLNNSSRYAFDGEDALFSLNPFEMIGNIIFSFYKMLVTIEIYLVVWSYKLELYKFLSGEIELLMNPITTVIFDTWRTPALLLLLLSAMIKSFYSKITAVINQIVIGIVVVVIAMIFLANPTKVLDEGQNVISSINSDILNASSISRNSASQNRTTRVDDYLVSLANQIWIVQVEKPWEILNFNNKTNALKYKGDFLKYDHGSKERDELTKDLRKTVPERKYDWITMTIVILACSLPKMIIIILLSALNLGTDLMIVILVIVSGLIFLLALIPRFGIGVLVSWFEKIVSALAISVVVTVGLTLLNEITAILYRKIDDWGILGVVIIDCILIIFMIIFRKWIFGGMKALRYGERGVKSALNNVPGISESISRVKEVPSNVNNAYKNAKNVASAPKRGLNSAQTTFAKFSKKGKGKAGDNDNEETTNQYEDPNNSDSTENEQGSSNSESHSKSEQAHEDNQNNEEHSSSNTESENNEETSKEAEKEYVKFTDYNEKMNINKKYKLDEASEEDTDEARAKTFLHNQYKMSRRDAEIEASEYVTLDGESKPVSYDEPTRQAMEREAKGEPLFTPEEIKKAEIHVWKEAASSNISNVEYVNKEEKVNLNQVLNDERTYNAKDAKDDPKTDGSTKSDNFDNAGSNDKKYENTNEEPENTNKVDFSMYDERSDQYESEKEATDQDNHENVNSNYNAKDIDDLKSEILDAIENSNTDQTSEKESSNHIGNTKHSIDEIIKNDIEEKHEVEEINKKLDNINRKVDRVEESSKENEIKQRKIASDTSGSGTSSKISDFSRLSNSAEGQNKLGDHNES